MLENDYILQQQMLPGVSRTFALTIPQLKEPLCTVVTTAYLLCRIADTIEDDTNLTQQEKVKFHQQFCLVLQDQADAENLAHILVNKLGASTLLAEKQLINNIPIVIRCLRGFTAAQQLIVTRCVNIMSEGMPEFQAIASLSGLPTMADLNRYCYCVAGVVGEMLTELFCDYSTEIALHKTQLMSLAVSFGQGLQMTNILKDFWEDRQRGVCWLPQDSFDDVGIKLMNWKVATQRLEFNQIFAKFVKKAYMHLQDALNYVLLIPANEVGIRRFTLWALGLAVLTLRNLDSHNNFTAGSAVKISRNQVKTAIFILNSTCRYNRILKYLFTIFARY